MPGNKKQLEDLLAYIREQRSNEGHFEALYTRLVQEAGSNNDEEYRTSLQEIKQKQVTTYRQASQKGAAAWPEFENFVSEFEKTTTEALKRAG